MFPVTAFSVATGDTENTATVRARVLAARAAAAERWADHGWKTNRALRLSSGKAPLSTASRTRLCVFGRL